MIRITDIALERKREEEWRESSSANKNLSYRFTLLNTHTDRKKKYQYNKVHIMVVGKFSKVPLLQLILKLVLLLKVSMTKNQVQSDQTPIS